MIKISELEYLKPPSKKQSRRNPFSLTLTEQKINNFIEQEFKAFEIAEKLGVKISTVRRTITRINEKKAI